VTPGVSSSRGLWEFVELARKIGIFTPPVIGDLGSCSTTERLLHLFDRW
jgi:hypothetical protein